MVPRRVGVSHREFSPVAVVVLGGGFLTLAGYSRKE